MYSKHSSQFSHPRSITPLLFSFPFWSIMKPSNNTNDATNEPMVGSNSQRISQEIGARVQAMQAPLADDLKSQDPFLYFSKQSIRMAYLTQQEEDTDRNAVLPEQEKVERKTRLSFEVHPCLLMDDFVLEMDGQR